jgi:hypothetical protein
VAVRRVDHDGVHTGPHQRFDTLFGTFAHAHSRAHAQTSRGIARRIGKAGLLGDVFDRDQAFELERVVDDQQALQA